MSLADGRVEQSTLQSFATFQHAKADGRFTVALRYLNRTELPLVSFDTVELAHAYCADWIEWMNREAKEHGQNYTYRLQIHSARVWNVLITRYTPLYKGNKRTTMMRESGGLWALLVIKDKEESKSP